MTNRLFLVLLLCLLSLPRFAQTTRPAGIDPAAMEKANITLLQRTIDRQHQEIVELKAQIASLTAQLKSLGVEPATAPTSQPSAVAIPAKRIEKPKRIVFFRLNNSEAAKKEIVRAVDELEPTQFFNVVSNDQQKAPTSFVPQFAPATETFKKKLEKELPASPITWGHFFEGLELASKGPPDVIWIVGWLGAPDEDAFIRDIKKYLKSPNIRINTSSSFAKGHDAKDLHLMWRVAKETGGVCLGEDGEPIEEPALPPPPAPEPERKSIPKTQ